MEELRMLAAKRKREQEDAARILLEKQVPVVTTPAPDEGGLKTVAPSAGAVQPEIDENGKIKQTGIAGQMMDMIFGSFLK
jgi:hypothetical protein